MTALQVTDPDTYQEFMHRNFAINKHQISFCAIWVDHALEHINRIMKVTGGLVGVGITQHASARERFFLTAPELSRLAEEAHMMAGYAQQLYRRNTMTCHWLSGQGRKKALLD